VMWRLLINFAVQYEENTRGDFEMGSDFTDISVSRSLP
jgi:hypothetical protein